MDVRDKENVRFSNKLILRVSMWILCKLLVIMTMITIIICDSDNSGNIIRLFSIFSIKILRKETSNHLSEKKCWVSCLNHDIFYILKISILREYSTINYYLISFLQARNFHLIEKSCPEALYDSYANPKTNLKVLFSYTVQHWLFSIRLMPFF